MILNVSNAERVSSITVKGNQRKWYLGGLFVKEDCFGYEGIAECLVSELLSHTDIPYGFKYVDYRECEIEEEGIKSVGCYSKDMLGTDEDLISVYRVLNLFNINIDSWLKKHVGLDRYTCVCDIDKSLGCELFKEYLSFVLTLDALVLNEDRHLNNLCFIRSKEGYRVSHIFDNGLSLLSDIGDYPVEEHLNVSIRNVKFKPFSVKYERQLNYVGISKLRIRYNDLLERLERGYSAYKPDYFKRTVQILKLRLRTQEGILWERI